MILVLIEKKPLKAANSPEWGWVKPKSIKKNDFFVNLIVFLKVKFHFSLKLSIVIFTFFSLGNNDFNMKLKSMISYIPIGSVYPIVVVGILFQV